MHARLNINKKTNHQNEKYAQKSNTKQPQILTRKTIKL